MEMAFNKKKKNKSCLVTDRRYEVNWFDSI